MSFWFFVQTNFKEERNKNEFESSGKLRQQHLPGLIFERPYLSDHVYVAEQERRLSPDCQRCDSVNGEKAECDSCRGREWDGLTWRGMPRV